MKPATSILGALALLLFGVGRAEAGQFTFSYADGNGNKANGTLDAIDSGLKDGSLLAISGILHLTTSADSGSVGTYTLLSAGPRKGTSPAGLFYVDNLIYPAHNAAGGVNPGYNSTIPSYLTLWGPLFGRSVSGIKNEANIWGTGNGDYAFYTGVACGAYSVQTNRGGEFVLTAVPEPATLTMLGFGIAGLAGYGWRRRKQEVATA